MGLSGIIEKRGHIMLRLDGIYRRPKKRLSTQFDDFGNRMIRFKLRYGANITEYDAQRAAKRALGTYGAQERG
jgi:hypothetical protein